MKKSVKILIIIIVVLVAIYGVVYFFDYQSISKFKLPIGVDADSFYGSEIDISRIGYSIKLYEEDGIIEKMQLTRGKKVIVESTGTLKTNSAEMKNELLKNVVLENPEDINVDSNNIYPDDEVISNKINTNAAPPEVISNEYIGIWYPVSATQNGKEVELSTVYGSDFSADDCITLSSNYSYAITYGLMNVDEEGLTGKYEITDSMLYLNSQDGSSSGYVLSDGKICEDRDGVMVVFERK